MESRALTRVETDRYVSEAREVGGVHPLDTEQSIRRLRKLEDWLEGERMRQSIPRYQMALDDDFFDGLQWDEEDARVLIERNQAPLVYNKVAPSVRWVTGTEKRTRVDYKIFPRSSDDRNEAENKTKVFKYLSDVNKSQFARSRAFEDAVKVGLGWLECGIRSDPTKELIYDRHESWRNMLHDSMSAERDLSDCRYIIRQKWLDTDVAIVGWPQRAPQIKAATIYSELADVEDADEWYLGEVMTGRDRAGDVLHRHVMVDSASAMFNRRERVRVYEMWYRMPARLQFIIGGGLNGVIFDPADDLHHWASTQEAVSIVERVSMRMYCGVFIKGTFLGDGPSPYRHNDFPFTPIWGNRRARDGTPYGMIRAMRDPQEDFNKRMSKALFALSTRRAVMDKGAVDDVEELREELARPDAIVEKKKGFDIEITTDTAIAEEHLQYANIDSMMIEQAGGVTDELLGRKTNAVSGKAIEARQDQGSTVTSDYFDNLRFGFQNHGQKLLSLQEQFMTMTKSIRVIGERKGYDFIEINKPEAGPDGLPTITNDIVRSQADFIVSQQDFRESMRVAAFEQLMDMAMKLAAVDPMIALKMLDDVIEFADLPGAEEVVRTIRDLTGKRPRDKQPTPDELAAEEAQKQEEAQKKAALEKLSLRRVALENEEIGAKIAKTVAEAMKLKAEANVTGMDGAVKAQYEEKMSKVREDTKKLIDALTDQVREAQNKANDRSAEIEKKYLTAIEEARIKAGSDADLERIKQDAENEREESRQETARQVAVVNRQADDAIAAVTKQLDDLQRMVDDASKAAAEAQKQASDAEKAAEKAAKDAEARVRESESRAAETQAKAQAQPAAAPQPIVIAVPTGEGGETRDVTLEFQTDAQGRIKAAKGTSTKRAAAKKPAGKDKD